ncbi:MAG: prepilin peptidase [Treponema sp.]|jgi:prepilin signal peptidase PulO-like enzyme (type II secretory pathway)|nr:prepilin peptidase [Treponema sp.]
MTHLFIFIAFAALISFYDLRCHRIPEALCAACFALLLLLRARTDAGSLPPALLAGAGSAAFFGLVRWKTHTFGLREVAFVALIGFFCGFPLVCGALLFAVISAFLTSLALPFFAAPSSVTRYVRLPFAPFLSLGAIAAVLLGGGL